jgi:hypothetical protein
LKRKMLVAVAITTVALLTLCLAFPLIVAPAPATSLPATAAGVQAANNKQSQQPVQALAPSADFLDWSNLWGALGFNFSANFTTARFTYLWKGNTSFGLNFARLVEFNDTQGNGIFNESDPVLQSYGLLTDINWNLSSIDLIPVPSYSNIQGFQGSITGNCTDPNNNFQIVLFATLFFFRQTITFRNNSYTIPSGFALKFGMNITGYQWQQTPNPPNSSRYLALVISLYSRMAGSVQCGYKWADGSGVANDTGGEAHWVGTDTRVSEVYFVDPSSGISYAKFNWFNGAWNGTSDNDGKSSFYVINDQMNISIAFPYNNFTSGDISIDPYFQFLPPDYTSLFLMLMGLVIMAGGVAGQAVSRLLLYGGIAALVVVGIVVVAVVLARRR